MKQIYIIGLAVIFFASGCVDVEISSPGPEKGTLKLTGSAGAQFTGCVVCDGQRIGITNATPWSFTGTRISEFEFRKVDPARQIDFEALSKGGGAYSKETMPILPGVAGIHGKIFRDEIQTELLEK